MGWTFDSPRITPPVVKQNGQCRIHALHKFCPYWIARHKGVKQGKGPIMKYRCRLFNVDKDGYASVPECNAKYGQNYNDRPAL